jgi:SSS family solute:Na+ symporter
VIAFGAGTGPVYILRWFWWRVNAWSEISAMLASSIITVYLFSASGLHFGARLLVITFGSGVIWLTVTFLTKPAPLDKLAEFFRRTKPYGAWGPVKQYAREKGLLIPKPESSARALRGFAWGMALVFGMTLGLGYLLLLNQTLAIVWLVVMVIGAVGLWKDGFLRTE